MLTGITGGIGSGKSTVAKALQERGYAVYDTDKEAQRIILTDPAVRRGIVALFGEEVYAGGVYQTAQVAQRVFADKTLLEQLNGLVHPAVAADLRRWAMEQQGPCFVESAILFESGLDRLCSQVVCVTAPEDVRIRRTILRDGSSEEKVRSRMRAQMSEDERIARSQIIVNNNGDTSIETLIEHIIGTL